ncbi:hypothetical protein SCOR_26775 [Sulfidibacter corallicola]|uniref:PmbA protein n=1 Tax=Sulfidibacter corallicola TaxID=2818388 RepID=A0A8A4TPK5_SULCO|nr:metallopeptidase TldD-related protein [Sulfidibacter corallicola]QTD50841.1 hypothetical protein J3U87_00100 [Sulfidibacter corallicola]
MKTYADLAEMERKAQQTLDMALSRGAHTAEAQVHRRQEFEVEVRNGDIENLCEAEPFEVALTVSRDHRRASVHSCDWSAEALSDLVDQAMVLCKYTDRDTFYALPQKDQLATEFRELDAFDDDILDMSVVDKIAMAKELENKMLAIDSRLRSDGASMTTMVSATAIANSAGFCRAESRTVIGLGVSGFAEDTVAEGDLNTGRKQSGSWGTHRRHIEDLRSTDEVAALAARQVLRKIGARKPRTGNFPVYFEPAVARSIWGHLFSAMTGGSIYRNESFLVDALGTRIGSDLLEITEDPFIPRGQASQNYDREGVAKTRRKLVDRGNLETYLLSTYSANKLNMKTTGHAGGLTNLLIKPGTDDEESLIRKMNQGVWVTGVIGQGVNVSTGDYSRGAIGLWIENGEVAYPVMEFTLNSNLKTMLGNISMIGDNVQTDWSVQTPGFVISEMAVSGT